MARERAAHALQPYEPPREYAPGVWCVDGDWYDTPMRRRMTILRLEGGQLAVHNPIRMRDEDYSRVEAFGPIAVIIAPNVLHSSDAHIWKRRYPEAKLYIPETRRADWGDRSPVDGYLPRDWPVGLATEIECHTLEGLRFIDESVFLHRRTKTLVVTDLVFNLRVEPRTLAMKTLFRLNGMYRRFGPTRFFRLVAIRNRTRFKRSIAEILSWDFDRVVMNHGEVLDTGGHDAFRRSFRKAGLA